MRFIGSKQLLLEHIEAILEPHLDGSEHTFIDLFGGTNIVGRHFKKKYSVISNDLLCFSHLLAKATVVLNKPLKFSTLGKHGIGSPLDYLQENAEKYLSSDNIGYYERAYSPTGDAMYLTVENAKRVDYIREEIEQWSQNDLVDDLEYAYLVATLIESIPFVSNITGTYGAYLKHWDHRALAALDLRPLEVPAGTQPNIAFNTDANDLVKSIRGDIAYIDPPYNNRQYLPNYHLLENVASHKKPELRGKTKLFSWTESKSRYSSRVNAFSAMKDLVQDVQAQHIVVSYNTEGIIPEEDLIQLLRENSTNDQVEIVRIPYRKYKSKQPTKSDNLHELLIYIKKDLPSPAPRTSTIQEPSEETTKNPTQEKGLFEIPKSWTAPKNTYIKSPLNYIGGKYRLLKQIVPLFPPNINTFVDLFSGGANVGINVAAKRHLYNDMNDKINEMFRLFQKSDPDILVEKIRERIEEFQLSKTNGEAYLKFRKQYNQHPNPLDLYVLASYSYNYQFRFNSSMEFNNPFGRNRSHFSANMERNLRLFIEQLRTQDAVFTDLLFDDFDFSPLTPNDFVYLDPPYLITTGSYNDGNRGFTQWGAAQESTLIDLMKGLQNRGIRYALSNVLSHKGRTNHILADFADNWNVNVHRLNYHYDNSSYNSKGQGSVEILLTNYDAKTFAVLEP